jgi:hypothetical protein
MNQIIELDCEPFKQRPGSLLNNVIDGLGFETKEPTTKSFGSWVWEYPEVPAGIWNEALPILKQRITNLYNSGFIRYGRWS